MCMSCGCQSPFQKHDERAIDFADLQAAADDAGISVEDAASNIYAAAQQAAAVVAPDAGLAVLKSEPERRYTLGLAYGAYLPDVGKAQDGFQDFARPEVLEEAAWSFLRKGGLVGLHHRDGTEGHGVVVESYIYRGPDWPQDNGYVVKSGDWLVGVQWDEPTWDLIKSGQIRGYSPQGSARRRIPTPEAVAQLRRQ